MILVIGGTGTIGSEVARQLAAAGQPFRMLARDTKKAAGVAGDGVEIVQGDIEKPETLGAAMRGVERMFLVTPLHLNQIQMKANAIKAAAAAGVKHVVMSTGVGASLESPVKLGRWHGESEKALKDSGMGWTFLQPTFFMQNFLMSAASIKGQGAFYLPLGDAKVAHVDARDIAAVGVAALTQPGHEGKAYPLTGPQALSCDEIGEIFSEVTGKKISYVGVSLEDAKAAMTAAGMPAELADALNELYALGPAGHLAGILDTVKSVTGAPARSFRQFAGDYAAAFK